MSFCLQEGRSITAVEAKPANRQSRKYSINKDKAPPAPPIIQNQNHQAPIIEEKRERKYSSASDDDEDEEDVRDLEGRIYTKKGQEVMSHLLYSFIAL